MLSLDRFRGFAPWIFVFLWATGFIVAKFAMPYAPPLGFLVLRFAATCALLLPVVLWLKLEWPDRKTLGHLMIAGVLVHAVYLGGVWCAVKWGMPAGLVALIVNMQPLLTAVASPWLGESVSRRQWLGLGLGFLGVGLVVWSKLALPGGGSDHSSSAGLFACVIGLLGITAGSLYQRHFVGQFDLRAGTLIQYLASLVLMAPLAWWFERQEFLWNWSLALSLAWAVIGLSIAAIFLMFALLRSGSAASVASLFYLVPPGTALMAWLLFGEPIGWREVAGLILTALAVYLVSKAAR